jgi:hypothetical protein
VTFRISKRGLLIALGVWLAIVVALVALANV